MRTLKQTVTRKVHCIIVLDKILKSSSIVVRVIATIRRLTWNNTCWR